MLNRVTMMGSLLGRQRDLQTMQADLARYTGEVASGRKSQLGQSLGVGVSVLYKLYEDLQQGGGLKNSTTVAGQQLNTMQTAMTAMNGLLGGLSTTGIQGMANGSADSNALIASQARQAMSTMGALLNTQLGGQSIFGGNDSARLPMKQTDAPGGALDSIRALVTAPVDAGSVDQLLASVDQVFNGPAMAGAPSYDSLFYQSASKSSDPATQVRIGPGQSISYNMRGDNQGVKDGLQALSLMSLLDAKDPATGADMLDGDARNAVLAKANKLLASSQHQVTLAAGMLGVAQQRLQTVSDIQDATVAAATAQIGKLEGADYYTASEQINALKVQIQATYSLTSTLSGLTLVNHLQ